MQDRLVKELSHIRFGANEIGLEVTMLNKETYSTLDAETN
jgi:hypothetical protein